MGAMSRDISSQLSQKTSDGLEGISTERTLEIIPAHSVGSRQKSKRAYASAVAANKTLLDPGRTLNQPSSTTSLDDEI